jgi:hypothetical protein
LPGRAGGISVVPNDGSAERAWNAVARASGSALNLNPHLHMLVPDGAYTSRGTKATFHRARCPTGDELSRLLETLARRIARMLERRGLLIADPAHPSLDLLPDSSLDHLQAARSVATCSLLAGGRGGRASSMSGN